MRLDANLANEDPTLAALVPDGVTLNHIFALFHTVLPVNGKQRLDQRLKDLGANHPANLALPELAEFIKFMFGAIESEGKNPRVLLAEAVEHEAKEAAAKLGASAKIGNITAHSESAGPRPHELENNAAGASAGSPLRPVAQTSAYGTTKAEDEQQPDKPPMNTAPQTISNPEATNPATADDSDEIVIEGRRLLSQRRVAKLLRREVRTLQRWRDKKSGPQSTQIGRKVYYELNDLQEWIDRGKAR